MGKMENAEQDKKYIALQQCQITTKIRHSKINYSTESIREMKVTENIHEQSDQYKNQKHGPT